MPHVRSALERTCGTKRIDSAAGAGDAGGGAGDAAGAVTWSAGAVSATLPVSAGGDAAGAVCGAVSAGAVSDVQPSPG